MDEACKKEVRPARKWAVITLHPWLPSLAEQIARARAWGLSETEVEGEPVGGVIKDDVRKVKRTTNWPAHLVERVSFIGRMKRLEPAGDTVFFATPLCVGFSAKLAQDTIEALWGVGMQVYVHANGAVYLAGDDLTEFLERVGADANAAHVRASRARKPKRQRKSEK